MQKTAPERGIMLRALCVLLTAFAFAACGTPVPRIAPPPPQVEPAVATLPNVRAVNLEDPIFGDYYYELSAGTDTQLPPILFVHGLGENGIRDWYPILSLMAPKRRVVAIDLPGFGRSARNNRHYNPAGYADLLASIIQARLGGHADVVGHSMGAAVSIALAGKHPQLVRRLVLLDAAGILCQEALIHEYMNPPAADVAIAAQVQRAAGSVLHELVSGFASLTPNLNAVLDSATLRKELLSANPERIAGLALIATNFTPFLNNVSAPTTLIWGAKDTVAPLRTYALLKARLPVSQSILFEGAGHNVPLERPFDVLPILDGFLGLGDAQTLAAEKAPPLADRAVDVNCRNEIGRQLSGRLARVKLRNCRGAQISDAHIEHLEVIDSAVSLTNVEVTGSTRLRDSELAATGSTFVGIDAISLEGSVADLAGVTLRGSHAAIVTRGERRSRLVASVVEVASGSERFALHGVTNFRRDQWF
jgi:pimeloyl-ACP methyl ester carboxylesterase